MRYPRLSHRSFALLVCLLAIVVAPSTAKKKNLPAVRWKAGTAGCEFERRDDGRYRWRWVRDDLDISVMMDSQELVKSQHQIGRASCRERV